MSPSVDVAQALLPAASALMPTCSVGAESKGPDESKTSDILILWNQDELTCVHTQEHY
jgi:hypothetical protein